MLSPMRARVLQKLWPDGLFPQEGDLTFSKKNANLLRPAAFGQSLLLAAVFRSVKRAYVSASRCAQAFRIVADAALQQVSVFLFF